MKVDARIVITGGGGLVGTALKRELADMGCTNVLAPRSAEVDLRDWSEAEAFFKDARPDHVFHLAARVYGIMGNMKHKGLSYFENVMINTHVIEASRRADVQKIVAMGSGAIYPFPSLHRLLEEADIWNGLPHPSEDSYAHAKRAMLAQLTAYREQYGLDFCYAVSGNLYGPNDMFDPVNGHVTPSLVAKFYEAKHSGRNVSVWGDGSARRDFMYSGDAARALLLLMKRGTGAVNIGAGDIRPIREIVDTLADISGMAGRVDWDASKPNGQDFRAYNLDRLSALGFEAHTSLREGLQLTWDWFDKNYAHVRR